MAWQRSPYGKRHERKENDRHLRAANRREALEEWFAEVDELLATLPGASPEPPPAASPASSAPLEPGS